MKELLFAWKILEIVSILGIANKIVVKSINPQTYTFYCTYSEERTNNSSLAGSRHIITCGNLDCKYYRRLINNAGGVAAGMSATTGLATGIIGAGSTAAEAAGVASFIVAAPVVTAILIPTFAVIGIGTLLTMRGAEDTVQGVEQELKSEWENERKEARIRIQEEIIRENEEIIDNLQSELDNTKQMLAETKNVLEEVEEFSEAQERWYERLRFNSKK